MILQVKIPLLYYSFFIVSSIIIDGVNTNPGFLTDVFEPVKSIAKSQAVSRSKIYVTESLEYLFYIEKSNY